MYETFYCNNYTRIIALCAMYLKFVVGSWYLVSSISTMWTYWICWLIYGNAPILSRTKAKRAVRELCVLGRGGGGMYLWNWFVVDPGIQGKRSKLALFFIYIFYWTIRNCGMSFSPYYEGEILRMRNDIWYAVPWSFGNVLIKKGATILSDSRLFVKLYKFKRAELSEKLLYFHIPCHHLSYWSTKMVLNIHFNATLSIRMLENFDTLTCKCKCISVSYHLRAFHISPSNHLNTSHQIPFINFCWFIINSDKVIF